MAQPADSTGSQPREAVPLSKRLLYFMVVFALQKFLIKPVMAIRALKQRLNPPETYPTTIKTFKCRPSLGVRIFFPKSYNRESPRPLPLLFTIHGGGFVVGDPSDNDPWNSIFSNQHNALVIGLNYAKAPGNHFPGPLSDLEAQVAAVFEDKELTPHIDPAKVGISGFSAGGNLTVGLSQFPSVRERITAGIVPIYPVLDFVTTEEQKVRTRRYKPALGGSRARPRDPLLTAAPAFDWAYIPAGQDTRDPLLSPIFTERSALPRRIWVIGCELDILGHEAWRFACKLAGREVPGLDQPIGQEELVEDGKTGVLITEGDERFAFEEKNRDGEIKWLCVPDAGHGFDIRGAMGADEKTSEDGRMKRDEIISMTGKWLFNQ